MKHFSHIFKAKTLSAYHNGHEKGNRTPARFLYLYYFAHSELEKSKVAEILFSQITKWSLSRGCNDQLDGLSLPLGVFISS